VADEKPQKLLIKPIKSSLPPISVPFNPTSYEIVKPVSWSAPATMGSKRRTQPLLNAPTLVFGGGGSRILTLDLLFDVTESDDDGNVIADVRTKTNAVVALTRIEPKQKRPPVCEVSWGKAPPNSDFPFTGVVSSLTQHFLLFRSTGEPVRARLGVVFTEVLDVVTDQRQTDPELTIRRVRRGDSITGIAADVYGDPGLWRVIADANNLDDPRRLPIGRTLSIPKIG
jgi:contractile injection system tube protein/LysM domain-containing protein